MTSTARWTHIAVPVRAIDASVDWYTSHTPLTLIARRHDEQGESAWLADPATVAAPMVLVLVAMDSSRHLPPEPTLAPFAHIGIELESRQAVDVMAARGEAEGCLAWPVQDLPDPVGYICALTDPDGNMIEFSHNQHVEYITSDVWSTGQVAGNGPRQAQRSSSPS